MKKISVKNAFSILAIFVVSACLAAVLIACVALPLSVAHAESAQMTVMIAPVSNLEGNATAGASSIKLAKGSFEFYIPESYYLTNVKNEFGNYYSVSYCGVDFFFESATAPQTTTVAFADGVSPSPDVLLTIKEGASLNDTSIASAHTIRFLGYSTTEQSEIFVMAVTDGEPIFSFEDRASFADFTVTYHPITQAERDRILESKRPVEPSGGDILPNTSLALRIVLIIGICVPAVIIAFLLFKPTKNAQGKTTMRRHRAKGDFDYDSTRTYNPDDANRYDGRYDGTNDRGGRNDFDQR